MTTTAAIFTGFSIVCLIMIGAILLGVVDELVPRWIVLIAAFVVAWAAVAMMLRWM